MKMKVMKGLVGAMLVGIGVAGAGPASGEERGTLKIIGMVHDVNAEAAVMVVREQLKGAVAQRSIELRPETRVLRSERDPSRHIVDQPVGTDEIRNGEYVVVTADREGRRLRAREVRIIRESQREAWVGRQ